MAGAYEYSLVQGNASGTDTNSWYLTSNEYTLRPEVGSYIANLASANTLFNTTLYDRLGETQYTDLLTGKKRVTSMWLRSVVGQTKFAAGNGQLDNKTNWSLVQLGGDIAQWTSNDTNRLHLGVMAGFGRSSSDSDARVSGYGSSGHIDGYSVGFYGTWYDNDADKSGLYVDSWVLWNHFNAKVDGQEQNREKYKLTGVTASLESGYNLKLGETERYDYWLQPKAQITYMGVDTNNHTESNGTKINVDANNWQSRLGLRFATRNNDKLSAESTSTAQLFIETNWLHNTESFAVKMDDNRISQDGARNLAEIKTGVEANILTNTNVWFNIGYQRGEHNYHNIGAMLGAKYSF
ncbi:outer membrane autotransporter protein [Orbus hercynius]|uniref:Outer membrane autotransporter protein n=1 Tax=Orbus hercynius TaxID=593135 RepID=A0A495RHV0_9GAMM|nr:autotransporter outer membrane beta-barrel domain-containing protein [Orbus hercynius]RKS86880.1 outer membrane autotransporter protein [Orbus hercynius]